MPGAANAHLLTPVAHYGAPVERARAVVILVHGRGHSPAYMEEFVVRRLGRPDLAYIAPTAANNTWYPKGFMEPLADNAPWLGWTLERMTALARAVLAQGIAPERLVWCGFSQGACVVSHHLALEPRRWGGLIAFTGGLIGPTLAPPAAGFAGMPAYFGASDVDTWVPLARVRETVAHYQRAGAEVRYDVFPGRAHGIGDAEIAQAQRLIDSVGAS